MLLHPDLPAHCQVFFLKHKYGCTLPLSKYLYDFPKVQTLQLAYKTLRLILTAQVSPMPLHNHLALLFHHHLHLCVFAQTVSCTKNGLHNLVILYRDIHALDWQEPIGTDYILSSKKYCLKGPVEPSKRRWALYPPAFFLSPLQSSSYENEIYSLYVYKQKVPFRWCPQRG